MAQAIYKKLYASDYEGIDQLTSNIQKDDDTYAIANNLEFSVSTSLRGRQGCQVAGSPGYFWGLFPYNYTRTTDQYSLVYNTPAGVYPNQTKATLSTTKTVADGTSINKIIGLSYQGWSLENFSTTFIKAGGTNPFTYYTTVSGGNIHFILKSNGATIVDFNCGDGINTFQPISALFDAINSQGYLVNGYATRTSTSPCAYATVNGAQTSAIIGSSTYGSIYSITVNASHTFYPGDILSFIGSNQVIYGGFVIATTGTTIKYVGEQNTFTNGQVLGYLSQSAAAIAIQPVVSGTGSLTITFPIWRLIPEGDYQFGRCFASPSLTWQNKTSQSFFTPPTATSASGCLYIASSGNVTDGTNVFANNLVKTDGQTFVRAGMQYPILTLTSPGVGILTGTYKYKCFFRRVDAQGNIVDGPLSNIGSVTAATNYTHIVIGGTDYASASGFQGRSCFKYQAQAVAANQFFYVDDNIGGPPGANAFIQPGDPICLLDTVAQIPGITQGGVALGTLHRTVCTDYDGSTTPSSIRVADNALAYSIRDNQEITTGFTVVVLRTTAGGNTFYKLAELPYTGYGGFQFDDNALDSDLITKAQYVEVTLGKEHNPPPPCSLVCQHQGGLVVARGVNGPNTVAYSTASGIEYFPTASNAFQVPSTQSGSITAIASDTADRLAVFKERGYYDVQGDLDGGAFAINVVTEGDFGITTQQSLVRVTDSLIGLSKSGFVVIQNGNLNNIFFMNLNSKIVNKGYNTQWATAFNDSYNRSYICTIPVTGSTPLGFAIDYSKQKVQMSAGLSSYAALGVPKGGSFDASSMNIDTFERSYATQVDQAGGGLLYGDTIYHLSSAAPFTVFRRLQRFSGNSPTGVDGDTFIDNTASIPYVLECNPINFGEPGQLKTPIRARVWSIANNYATEGWVTFSTLIETGCSANSTFVGSSSPLGTGSTVTFSTINDLFKDVKLNNGKTFFYIVRLTTNTIRQAPFWTGIEIGFIPNYDKTDLNK